VANNTLFISKEAKRKGNETGARETKIRDE
jgi:hypothetical protein